MAIQTYAYRLVGPPQDEVRRVVDPAGVVAATEAVVPVAITVDDAQKTQLDALMRYLGYVETDGTPLRAYAEDEATTTTTSASLTTALAMTTPALATGVYRLSWYAEISSDAVLADVRVTADLDAATTLADVTYDASIAGVFQDTFSGFRELALAAGVHTVRMQMSRVGGLVTDSVSLRRRRLSVVRLA